MSKTRYALMLCLCFLCAAGHAIADRGQDIVVGTGSNGPYALSYKGIEQSTETVHVNQQPQTRGADYTVDAISGTVTFTRPLPPQSAASVTYEFDPAQAMRVSNVTRVPLSFDLAHTASGRVSVDALYLAPGALTLGIGTGWQSDKTSLTTHIMFAPALASGQTPNDLSRMAFTAAGSADAALGLHLNFGYARAGDNIGAGTDSALTAGMQTLTFGTRLTPSDNVQATMDVARSQAIAGDKAGSSARTAASLTVSPLASVQVQSHWAQTMQDGTASTQSGDVSVSAQPTVATHLDARYASTDAPGTASDTQTMNLAASLTPSQKLALTAAIGQNRDSAGAVNRQQFGLALTPGASYSFNTALALRQTDTGQVSTATVSGQMQPVSFLQVSAGYTGRVSSAVSPSPTDILPTSTASLTVSPLRGLRLTGSYAQNPDNGGDTPQRLSQRSVGLETHLGALALTGGCDWQQAYASPAADTALHIGLGLCLSDATRVSGGYQQSRLGVSLTGSSIYTFGVTHDLSDAVHFALDGMVQTPVGPAVTANPDYTAHASLGLKF